MSYYYRYYFHIIVCRFILQRYMFNYDFKINFNMPIDFLRVK